MFYTSALCLQSCLLEMTQHQVCDPSVFVPIDLLTWHIPIGRRSCSTLLLQLSWPSYTMGVLHLRDSILRILRCVLCHVVPSRHRSNSISMRERSVWHVFQTFRYRLWSMIATVDLAAFGEVAGWIGRLWSSYDPNLKKPFMIQSVTSFVSFRQCPDRAPRQDRLTCHRSHSIHSRYLHNLLPPHAAHGSAVYSSSITMV